MMDKSFIKKICWGTCIVFAIINLFSPQGNSQTWLAAAFVIIAIMD